MSKSDLELLSPYFTHKELACKQTAQVRLAKGFASKLLTLRQQFNQPMIVTSCCRSKNYNDKISGHPRSLHVYDLPYYNTGGSCAIDIAVTNSNERGKLISTAWQLGWSIGIHHKFIHFDRRGDYTKLPQAVFLY